MTRQNEISSSSGLRGQKNHLGQGEGRGFESRRPRVPPGVLDVDGTIIIVNTSPASGTGHPGRSTTSLWFRFPCVLPAREPGVPNLFGQGRRRLLGAVGQVGGRRALEHFAGVAGDGDVQRGGHLGPSLLLAERSDEAGEGCHWPRAIAISRVAGVGEHGVGSAERDPACVARLVDRPAVEDVRPPGSEGEVDSWGQRSLEVLCLFAVSS